MKRFTKLFASILLTSLLVLSTVLPQALPTSAAEPVINRIWGMTLYDTAIQISQSGWLGNSAPPVVLATGEQFPDALAGTVLAHKVNGPLLLSRSTDLNPEVLNEILRLGSTQVYILGGPVAMSPTIEQLLNSKGIHTTRLAGWDQYGTAAQIAAEITPHTTQVFLVTGENYPDAMTISSYAAAHNIPILMTRAAAVPSETLQALQQLEVTDVTLIGGTAVISNSIQTQLASLPTPIKVKGRLAGYDLYETNTAALNSLQYDTSTVYVATGEGFADGLAGAVLASRTSNPVLLVPRSAMNQGTLSYLNTKRSAGAAFTILGGWGAISYGTESIVRTGAAKPRISLQYLQGSAGSMLNQVNSIPSQATDFVDIISPEAYSLSDRADGSLTSDPIDSAAGTYANLVGAAHSRGLKVLPMVNSSWATSQAIDTVLPSPALRANLENQIVDRIQSTGVDGVVIDFEFMNNATGPGLTAFMQELYPRLNSMNKLVVIAVMARTGSESWLTKFDYAALAQSANFLHVMTYDYGYSSPAPIAPLNWMNQVLQYTRSQGVDMQKVLLGISYYGRDWWITNPADPGSYSFENSRARGLNTVGSIYGATELMNQYQATLQRDSSSVPYFSYSDSLGSHTVYYDDYTSWNVKLSLLNQYGLGGIGAWSLYWLGSPNAAGQAYPLLKQHLR